jgi:hypothetical protein
MRSHTRPGFSLIGTLITMACLLVLMVISLNAINRAITGAGTALPGTVRSTQDMAQLYRLHQAFYIAGRDMHESHMPVPSAMVGSDDYGLNTTANLYSALIARQYLTPELLVAANEFNPYIGPMFGYNYFAAHNPVNGIFWDMNFSADLSRRANVSFAHMPLSGERYERGWNLDLSPRVVMFGNRGPKDGIDNPESFTYGRGGVWGGHIVYADGNIVFLQTFTPDNLRYELAGETHPDNIFAMETGPFGSDVILAFTEEMTSDGPVLQYD